MKDSTSEIPAGKRWVFKNFQGQYTIVMWGSDSHLYLVDAGLGNGRTAYTRDSILPGSFVRILGDNEGKI